MIFSWWTKRRRKKILKKPFPKKWLGLIESCMPYYSFLSEDEQRELRNLIQIFIAEKDWLGGDELLITDEIKLIIAAHACILILKIPHDYYSNVVSIIVYPTTVYTPAPPMNIFGDPTIPVFDSVPVLGAAHYRGPLILVWNSIKREIRHPERGHNVIFHEFAHKLDMMDGYADGTPPLMDKESYDEWARVCTIEFESLKESIHRNQATLLDPYGATNEAEFFAVVTELFFTKPKEMKDQHSRLYELMSQFYNQDPESVWN
jgi:hypothetical protein